GGSDLGPAMATLALAPYHDGPRCHFVSNVDGAHLADTLQGLDPERTLVIVASKTFTTVETMTNAASARRWMAERVTEPGQQFVALSSAVRKAEDFGIAGARVFG
ncbi:MAG TPA: glucose-6-phosphate isomerase, partial [Rhodobacteraceae bacterium]|nr:glucose-6-phosphate isomerase [Paracoccaceae bacterium]